MRAQRASRTLHVGNAFALQGRAIFAALLARYEFSLAAPPESCPDERPSLILRTSEPCRLRYRRRTPGGVA